MNKLNEEKEILFAAPNRYNLIDLGILFSFHKMYNLQDRGVQVVNISEKDRWFFHGISEQSHRVDSNVS